MTAGRGWALGVAMGLGLGLGCGHPKPSDHAAEAPAANARVVLDEARRELADPERVPLRRGMEIDGDRLHAALVELRARHGEAVAVAYDASIEALASGALPGAPRFSEVAAFSLPDDGAAREVEAINWLFDADVRQTAQRVLGTYLTLMMVEAGMTTQEVGIWMAFLRAAEPELRRCGGQGQGIVLCMDYGSDVFVLDVVRREPAWVVTRLRWMQAAGG